ncbi:MAG: M23 family metallopeptidase [Oligoflexia bacterium]|nr:M23 family metallopeptidase [Oligoflexia bacterium]
MTQAFRLAFAFFVLLFTLSSNALANATDISTTIREVTPGQTFEDLLLRAGFSKRHANRLLVNPTLPTRMNLTPNEKYLIIHNKKLGRTEACFYLDYYNEAVGFWFDKNGDAGVERKPIDFKIVTKTFFGRVRGSIVESIKKLIPDEWPAARFVDAFSWDLNLAKKLVKDDSFKFTIEEKYDHGHFVKYGEILNAELETNGNRLKRVLWRNERTHVFVDPSMRFEDRPFYAPVDYLHISSQFSRRRFHPVRRNYQAHLGTDFALPEGSPVYATRDGIINDLTRHRANGILVQIRHDHGFVTTYNHLQRWAPNLTIGKAVRVGEIIGYVGCTGYCTSPHLHLSIRNGNYLYDPVYLTKPFPHKERNYHESNKYKTMVAR